jgi:hypothetical protein
MQARAPQSNSHGVRSRRLSEEVCSISGVEEIRIHSLHTSGLRRLFVAVVPSTQRPPDRARVCRRPAAVACRVAPVRRASEPFAANDSQFRLCVFGCVHHSLRPATRFKRAAAGGQRHGHRRPRSVNVRQQRSYEVITLTLLPAPMEVPVATTRLPQQVADNFDQNPEVRMRQSSR